MCKGIDSTEIRLRQSLAMIQSSSPSFPILASLDISRAMIDALGRQLFEQSLDSAASFRKWLKQHINRRNTRNENAERWQ